jgi:hypothetical protein
LLLLIIKLNFMARSCLVYSPTARVDSRQRDGAISAGSLNSFVIAQGNLPDLLKSWLTALTRKTVALVLVALSSPAAALQIDSLHTEELP